jgi:hypothetical protein
VKSYDLTVRFTAEDDHQANRITEALGRGLEAAGAEVGDAQLIEVPSARCGPHARLFARTDTRAVPTAAAPLDEDVPADGAGYRAHGGGV